MSTTTEWKARRTWLMALVLVGCASDLADSEVALDGEAEVGVASQAIVNGMEVSGAGIDQRWEGIVRLNIPNKGGCTGTFITQRHILSAAHCFERSSSIALTYSGPGLASKTITAEVTQAPCYGPRVYSCDIAVAALQFDELWATPERRFRVYGGSTYLNTLLHPYGYGFTNNGGAGSGVLRTAPNRGRVSIASHTSGYFDVTAGPVNACEGDSGGPALSESETDAAYPPVQWGVVSTKIARAPNRLCASDGEIVRYTKTTTNLSFIESVLGYRCANEGWGIFRCW